MRKSCCHTSSVRQSFPHTRSLLRPMHYWILASGLLGREYLPKRRASRPYFTDGTPFSLLQLVYVLTGRTAR